MTAQGYKFNRGLAATGNGIFAPTSNAAQPLGGSKMRPTDSAPTVPVHAAEAAPIRGIRGRIGSWLIPR